MAEKTTLCRAWKGEGDDARIFFSLSQDEGKTWSPQHDVAGLTSDGPALTSFKGVIYRAWKGEGDDARIFLSSINGFSGDRESWDPEHEIVGLTSGTPALAEGPLVNVPGPPGGFGSTNEFLYRAWKGRDDDERMFISSTTDGKNWAPEQPVPGRTSHGPSLATRSNTLYRAWKGVEGDNRLFMSSTTDGKNWTPERQIPGETSHGPAIAWGPGDRIHRIWKGAPGDSRMFISSTSNGTDWTPDVPISGFTSNTPALAGTSTTLYRLWKGVDNDARIFFSTSRDGNTWTPETPIEGLTSHGPSLVVVVEEIIH